MGLSARSSTLNPRSYRNTNINHIFMNFVHTLRVGCVPSHWNDLVSLQEEHCVPTTIASPSLQSPRALLEMAHIMFIWVNMLSMSTAHHPDGSIRTRQGIWMWSLHLPPNLSHRLEVTHILSLLAYHPIHLTLVLCAFIGAEDLKHYLIGTHTWRVIRIWRWMIVLGLWLVMEGDDHDFDTMIIQGALFFCTDNKRLQVFVDHSV